MKKIRNIILLLTLILTEFSCMSLETAKSTPYQIYNYGVGVSPIPVELGMNISVIGGYTLKYNPTVEEGYAIFRLRNTTHIISEIIYTEQEEYIEKIVNFTLSPENWAPGTSGALAIAQLDLVIKTESGVYTDNSSVYFYIQRAAPICKIRSLTTINTGYVKIIFELCNTYNHEYKVKGVLVNTQITFNSKIIAENISITDINGLFNINFRQFDYIKQYNITVITGENQQYKPGFFNFTISLDINTEQNKEQTKSHLLIIILTIILIAASGYIIFKKTKRKPDLIIH